MVVDSERQSQDAIHSDLVSENIGDGGFFADHTQLSKDILSGRAEVLRELTQYILTVVTPGELIALIAIIPDLKLVAWDQLLVISPPVDVYYHLLGDEDMRGLAQAEIDRLKPSRQKSN